MGKDDFVHFDFKEAAIKAIAEKVVVDLAMIFGEGNIPCQLIKRGAGIVVRFEEKSIFIECDTLNPYFYCPAFPQKVYIADLTGSLRRAEFFDLLRKVEN